VSDWPMYAAVALWTALGAAVLLSAGAALVFFFVRAYRQYRADRERDR